MSGTGQRKLEQPVTRQEFEDLKEIVYMIANRLIWTESDCYKGQKWIFADDRIFGEIEPELAERIAREKPDRYKPLVAGNFEYFLSQGSRAGTYFINRRWAPQPIGKPVTSPQISQPSSGQPLIPKDGWKPWTSGKGESITRQYAEELFAFLETHHCDNYAPWTFGGFNYWVYFNEDGVAPMVHRAMQGKEAV